MILYVSIAIIGGLTLTLGIVLLMWGTRRIRAANQLLEQAKQQMNFVKKECDSERREILSKLKEELHKKRTEFDQGLQREQAELDRLQKKVSHQLGTIQKREQHLDDLQHELQQKERVLSKLGDQLHFSEKKLKVLNEEVIVKLENISGLTREDARFALLKSLEADVMMANEKWIQKEEETAYRVAKEKSIQIIVNAMQRYTADQVAPHSSGVVQLPNDDMKGRIIGKEGRNIKAFRDGNWNGSLSSGIHPKLSQSLGLILFVEKLLVVPLKSLFLMGALIQRELKKP